MPFKPGDLVRLTSMSAMERTMGLSDIIGVITIDKPILCQHDGKTLAYHVFWLSTHEPEFESCSGSDGFIHAYALELFVPELEALDEGNGHR